MTPDLPFTGGEVDDTGTDVTGIDLGRLAALANDLFRSVPGHDLEEPLPTGRAALGRIDRPVGLTPPPQRKTGRIFRSGRSSITQATRNSRNCAGAYQRRNGLPVNWHRIHHKACSSRRSKNSRATGSQTMTGGSSRRALMPCRSL